MRVALLARVSTEGQAEAERHSMPAQMRAMWSRVEREGWEVVRTFEAPGESASTRDLNKRPVLRELVEAARRREFDLVLFHESSRLARDEEMAQRLLNELESLGVRLVEADKPVDHLYTSSGRVQYGIESVLNAWQSRKHGEQVAKGKREQFESGLHVGDVPFGYRRPMRELADGTVVRDASVPLEVVEEEAVWIRRAFEERLTGVGATETAERWNAAGLVPHSKQGNGVFTPSALESIFENDFYCGYVHYRGERRRGLHEAILSEDVWVRVQERSKRGSKPVRARSPRALSGVAVCAECGGPMWLSWSGDVRYPELRRQYYRETSKIRQRPCANRGTGWDASQADEQVGDVVRAMSLDREWLASVDREARRVPKADAYAEERSRLLNERRRASRLYIAGDLEDEEWGRIRESIDARVASLPSPLPGGVLFQLERLKSVGEVWDGMTVAEKREGVRLLFERVEMDTRAKAVWLKPWEEVEHVFRMRREWCVRLGGGVLVSGAPPAGFGRSQLTNPRPWLYLPAELVA